MRVLIRKEGDMFVGQCLEHDICTQGGSVDELMSRLVQTIQIECQERDGSLEDIAPAPEEYHNIWDKARPFEDDDSGHKLALAA